MRRGAPSSRWLHHLGDLAERPSFRVVVVAALLLAAADWASHLAGSSFFPGGPLDETAHLLTTLFVLWALVPLASPGFRIAALVASVVIDVDHVPGRLGANWLTRGTPRPYTHSLLVILCVLLLALFWRRRRPILLGVALGLTVHFWRDLSEPGGVPLLWPISDHAFSDSRLAYLVAAGLLAILALWRARRAPRASG